MRAARAVISESLRRMCGEDPRASLLTTIPGVGYYIALLIARAWGCLYET